LGHISYQLSVISLRGNGYKLMNGLRWAIAYSIIGNYGSLI